MNTPLNVMIEQAKMKMVNSFNQVVQESHLPAYLIEGILLGILADVREQKSMELTSDYINMIDHTTEERGTESNE